MTSITVAVTQPIITADARTNGQVVRSALREAAGRGARLVLFPEGMMSGYAKEQIEEWSRVDWAVVAAELAATAALAAELEVWVVIGSAHRLTEPHWPHNSLYVISDRGELVDRYDKRFCSATETSRFFSPGSRAVVIEIDGYRFGCLLCVEINFPALLSEYEDLGIDCLLLAAYPVDEIFTVKARAYAAIHTYWVALSAPAQTQQLVASTVIGPDGQLKTVVDTETAVAVLELDRDAPELQVPLTKAKPWRAAAKTPGYYPASPADDPRSSNRTAP